MENRQDDKPQKQTHNIITMGYIYKITNSINGKLYVGKTSKTIEERFVLHIQQSRAARGKTYLNKAFRKYGHSSFIIEVVEEIADLAIIDDREIYWINELNSLVPNGYNLTKGGTGGDTSTSENYKNGILSRPSTKGERNPNFGKLGANSPNFGKKRTKAQLKNLQDGLRKGWDNSERRKLQSIKQTALNKSGKIKKPYTSITIKFNDKIYYSLNEASRDTGYSPNYIKKHGEIINEPK